MGRADRDGRSRLGWSYLAARTGMPIVPTGVGYDRPWRAGSWDRFAVPRPWSRGRCVLGKPIFISPRTDRDWLEEQRLRVQEAMDEVNTLAEQWAETGEWPGISGQVSGLRSQESGIKNQEKQWRLAG